LFEILSLGINVLLALIAIGALCVYNSQLSVMRGTLTEMKRSGAAATDQAWQAIGNINWLARTMDGAFQQNRQAMEASERQSKAALDASIEVTRTDQRAWVGVIETEPPTETVAGENVYIKAGSHSIFRAVIANSGRTPALSVTTSTGDAGILSGVPFVPRYDYRGEYGIPVIQPAAKFWILTSGDHAFTAKEIDAVKSGTFKVYFFGMINYKDVFGKSHRTNFCAVLDRNLKNFNACSQFNDAN